GDRHDRVVERGLDVGVPHRDVLPFALLGASRALPLSHGSPMCSRWDRWGSAPAWTYFLRRMPTVRRGPRRWRAFVLVRWPRTGRLRRWRTPRYEPIAIRRLTSSATSRRMSPSTLYRPSNSSRIPLTGYAVRSPTRASVLLPRCARNFRAVALP